MNSCIYILKSLVNNRFYIGSTSNISRRLTEHSQGKSKYTKTIKPFELVLRQEFPSLRQARRAEKWLKAQKSKKFIEKVIQDKGLRKIFDNEVK